MNLKQVFFAVTMLLNLSSAFAGNEDWTGVYNFQDSTGKIQTVTHTPSKVSFMFFSAGTCVSLSKGTKINGLEIKDNVNFCVRSKVSTFTSEVQKLGLITAKTITLGPNYKDE